MIFRLRFALQSIFLSFLLLPLISSSILPSNPNSNIVSSLSKRQEDSSSASSEEDNIDTLITNLSSSVKSLTSLTFDTTVTSSNPSAYLIEFFQPWCAHCQAFAPVWQDLCEVKVHLEDSSKFHLRRINCEENGDLCSREGVKSYPHIALYFDGKFVEKYKGSRSFENLNTYIRARTADYREIRASNLGMI